MGSGVLPPRSTAPTARIRPVWQPAGEPRVQAFELSLDAPDREPFVARVEARYLEDDIAVAIAGLARDGRLDGIGPIDYELCAHRDPAWSRRGDAVSDEATLEPIDEPLDPAPLSLATALARCERHGPETSAETDVPCIVPREVLDECIDRSRRAGDVEAGGLLVGRLVQNPDTSELGVVIRAHIPARHTRADRTSLTFTARTWADADAAISLRGDAEQVVGWVHHHPNLCARCPLENREGCPYASPFFSEADRTVHRAAFPNAWSVGLLLSWYDDPEPSVDMYGWRQGRIEARAFHVATSDAIEEFLGVPKP